MPPQGGGMEIDMKKILYKSICAVVSAVFCLNASVFAEDNIDTAKNTIDISVDLDTNRITISGNLINSARRAAAVTVINPDATGWDGLDETLTPDNAVNYIEYSDAKLTGEDGSYAFTYINRGNDGTYQVRVTAWDGTTLKGEYPFAGNAMGGYISDINTAKRNKDFNTLAELVPVMYPILNIQCNIYDDTVADEELRATYLANMGKALAEKGEITKPSEFVPQFEDAAMLACVNMFSKTDDFEKFMDKYADSVGAQVAYAVYKQSLVKADIIKDVSTTNNVTDDELKYESVSEFVTDLEKQAILISVKKANGWQDVRDILTAGKSVIKDASGNTIDIEGCEKLSGYENVYKSLEGRACSTLSELKAAFDAEVIKLKNPASGSDSETGNVGGNGGGGGGRYVPTPIENDAVTTKAVFADLDNYSWAQDSILSLYNKKIVDGVGEGKFAPEKSVSRSEFIKMLILTAGLYDGNAVSDFADVKEGDWQYSYVSSAYKNGIIQMNDEKRFGRDDDISREDMAVMCFRTLEKLGLADGDEVSATGFEDEGLISDYALKSVAFLKKIGLIQGMTDLQFSPKTSSNRAQAAVIIERFIDFMGGTK